MKRIVVAAALVCSTVFFFGSNAKTAWAAQGWTNDNGDWKYLDNSGQPVSEVWEESNGSLYYLGPDGRMEQDSLVDTGNGLYYVDKSGKMAADTWIFVNNQKNPQYQDGWYYFGANGKAFQGVKKLIHGKYYVFDENGKMLTGWIGEDLEAIGQDGSPLVDGVYYAGKDGALFENAWLNDSDINPLAAQDLASQVSGMDYSDYPAIWLYFDGSGKRIKGTDNGLRQKTIDGKTYGFDENGIMVYGWDNVATQSDASSSTTTTDQPPRFFSPYNGGKLLKDTWIYMYPSENLDPQDYLDQKYSWWHTDGSGKVYQNTIRMVKDKRYAFDGIGRMQGGFVFFRGRNDFVARYDTDAYASDDFKTGSIIGLGEGNDQYLFAPDTYNDGSMQTGKNIKVELADGVFTFGFGSNGIAYGNQNKLRRVDNAYYINGLRLEADPDYGYGVVVDQNGTARLVNTNGMVVTGSRKVVRDGDGSFLVLVNGKFMARVEDGYAPKWHNGPAGPGFYHYDGNSDVKYGDFITDGTQEPQLGTLPSEELLYDANT